MRQDTYSECLGVFLRLPRAQWGCRLGEWRRGKRKALRCGGDWLTGDRLTREHLYEECYAPDDCSK